MHRPVEHRVGKGGVGRTGTLVGCYYVWLGLTTYESLACAGDPPPRAG